MAPAFHRSETGMAGCSYFRGVVDVSDEEEFVELLPELRLDDVVLLFLSDFVDRVLRSLLLLFDEFVLSVVELAPALPGVCGVPAGAGGAF